MRRGFVFTLDAILALVLLLIVVTGIEAEISSMGNVYSTVMRSKNTYTAEDIMNVLENVPLSSLVSPEVIREWTATGVLNTSLVSPSMPPLKIALTYWALSNVSQYRNLNLIAKAGEILNYTITHNFPGYGYQLFVNSTIVASFGNASNASDISVASAVVSGYRGGEVPQGYIARAYLTRVQHRYSELIGIQRVVARGYGNTLHVEVPVLLPQDAKDVTAWGAFYARWLGGGNDITLYVTNESGTYWYGDLGSGSTVNLTGYIGPGLNVLNFTITSSDVDEVGFGSGSVLLVSYTTNSTFAQNPNKIDLYDVKSDYGFVQFVTVIPTGNVTGITARLVVSGVNKVTLYYDNGTSLCYVASGRPIDDVVYFNSSEIAKGLEGCEVTYSDLNSRAFTLVFGFDASWPKGSSEPSYSKTNTTRHLYGFGESWVQVDVKSDLRAMQYAVPLSITLYPWDFSYLTNLSKVGSNVYKKMKVHYYLPPKAVPWYADYWIGIEYSGTSSGNLEFEEYNNIYGLTLILEEPLDYYLYRFGYAHYTSSIMVPGKRNTFKVISTSKYYGFREGKSWGIIYYFLQAYAPYGKVFPELLQGYPNYRGYNLTYWAEPRKKTIEGHVLVGSAPYLSISVNQLKPSEYAVDDAIIRLFEKLARGTSGTPGSEENPLAVLIPNSVNVDFSSMNGIPASLSTVTVRIRVWRLMR